MKPLHHLSQEDASELLAAPYNKPIRLSECWALRVRVDLENGLEEDQFFAFDEQSTAQFFIANLFGRLN